MRCARSVKYEPTKNGGKRHKSVAPDADTGHVLVLPSSSFSCPSLRVQHIEALATLSLSPTWPVSRRAD